MPSLYDLLIEPWNAGCYDSLIAHQEFTLRTGAKLILPLTRDGRIGGLSLYGPQRLLGQLAKGLIRFGVLQGNIVGISKDNLQLLRNAFRSNIADPQPNFAFHFGTGKRQKLVIAGVGNDGQVRIFGKVAHNEDGERAILHESAVLKTIGAIQSISSHIPYVLKEANLFGRKLMLISSGVGKPAPKQFGESHLQFIRNLQSSTSQKTILFETKIWTRILNNQKLIRIGLYEDEARRWTSWIGRTFEDQTFALSHGDFCSWNMRKLENGRLFVFDWEEAVYAAPRSWDFYHFTLMPTLARQQFISEKTMLDALNDCQSLGFCRDSQTVPHLALYLISFLYERTRGASIDGSNASVRVHRIVKAALGSLKTVAGVNLADHY